MSVAHATTINVLEIILSDRQPDQILDEAIDALVAANEPPALFTRSGAPVRVLRDEERRVVIREADADAILERLYVVARWYRKARKGFTDTEPPRRVAVGVRERLATQPHRLPPLRGVVGSPVMRPDGSILDSPGYDRATRLVYAPEDGFRMPKVPAEPSLGDREAAIALLDEIMVDFPFLEAADRASALAFLFTILLRELIDGPVPMVIFTAPSQGTGKSLLLGELARLATGQPAAVSTMPDARSDEEIRKVITTLLRSGRAVAVLDNVMRPIDSGNLSALLTATRWTDRLMRTHDEVDLPNRSAWAATGNNVTVRGDMARRTYWCRLDAKVPRPWTRDGFRHPDLGAWVAAHRGELLAAALTLARSWHVGGRPDPGSEVPTLGGFDAWRRVVGGVLAAAGVQGFLGNLSTIYDSADEETPAWAAFLAAWFERYEEEPVTVADLVARLHDENEKGLLSDLGRALPPELSGALGKPSAAARRIGNALRRQAEKRFPVEGGSLHLEKTTGDRHTKVAAWRVRWRG